LFLHFGPVHLAMNMIGLLAIGPFVERALGRWRYSVCYLGAGIFSNALVVALALSERLRYELLVGASGSVMGLVGATAAICWQDWRRLKTQTARRRLRWAALVVVLQTVFDLATPQVSFSAHLSGAIAGFLIAALLHRRR
jgi:rhomboid protease GluP